MDKAGSAASEGRVKAHVFEPSGRVLWTVVGRGGERWIDPDAAYCSCPAFYFARTRGRGWCYHLESARIAREGGGVERTAFADDEFASFVHGLADDM